MYCIIGSKIHRTLTDQSTFYQQTHTYCFVCAAHSKPLLTVHINMFGVANLQAKYPFKGAGWSWPFLYYINLLQKESFI